MIPNTSSNITFPKNSFTHQWDEIVVKGEVYRAFTHIDHLEDPSNDKLNVSIKINKEDFAAMNKHRVFEDLKLSGIKKVEVKVKKLDENDEPLKDEKGKFIFEEDDEGNEIKEFSHYQLTLAMNPYRKDKDTGEYVPRELPIKVRKGVEFNPKDRIAEGSKVIVKGSLWSWEYQGKKGGSMNLSSIAVPELIKLETGSFDPFAGMDLGDDFDDVEVPTFETKAETKTESKPQEADTGDDDFGGEDPFA